MTADHESELELIQLFLSERRSERFYCPHLGSCGATISLKECVARQQKPEQKNKSKGKAVEYKVKSFIDAWCRSGDCALGRTNRTKLTKLNRGKRHG